MSPRCPTCNSPSPSRHPAQGFEGEVSLCHDTWHNRRAQPELAASAIPAGWVPLTLEWEPGYPEDVAFGPQRMMDRLKKWLDKYFANVVAERNAAPSVAPEPVAWTLQSELDAAQTTCSAHLWFTNPCNSAWTALFTREQIAAHPPRATLPETLHTFLNAAAGEGLVLDGVDAADLYIALFPERYAAAVNSIDSGAAK